MLRKDRYFLWGISISVIGALCFSSKAIFVKLGYAYSEADTITLLAVRMLGSIPFFALTAGLELYNADKRKKINRKVLVWIFITGLLGYYLASLLDFAGLQFVSAALERLILFIYPTLVLLASRIFFGQHIEKTQWLAVLITYLGILLAFIGEKEWSEDLHSSSTQDLWTGANLILGCAVAYAGYIVLSSRLIPTVGASLFNSLSMLAASAGVLIHYSFLGTQPLSTLSSQVWKYGLLMAIFATVIPSYLITESIKRIGGGYTAIIASIGPVSTILMAYWWLGEPITVWQIAGTILILVGVWMITQRKEE